MWIVIFDNTKGKFPEGLFLGTLKNFINFFKENSEVETFLLSEKKIKAIKIKSGKVYEKQALNSYVNGILISFSLTAVEWIIKDDNLRAEFLRILNRLNKNAPIIFFSGKSAFQKIRNYLKGFNCHFEPRRGVNWFNIRLKEKLKQFL